MVAEVSVQQSSHALSRQAGTGTSNLVVNASKQNSGAQASDAPYRLSVSGIALFTALGLMTLLSTPTASRANTGAHAFGALEDVSLLRSKFLDDLAEYETDDWDGDGAKALAKKDSDNARSLLSAIAIPSTPDIVVGADGSVCMEWIRQSADGERKIFVDVGPGGRVLTYAKFGNSSPIEKHFDEYGPSVIQHLQVLFNVFSVG